MQMPSPKQVLALQEILELSGVGERLKTARELIRCSQGDYTTVEQIKRTEEEISKLQAQLQSKLEEVLKKVKR